MTARPAERLTGTVFDVVVIGGGINGAAAAAEAARAGYRVALFERDDFGSGATSRSSRLIHCGLRYLAPGGPMSVFLRHPGQFARALRTVRRAMMARNALVRLFPDRVRPIQMQFPIYADGPYAPWQVDAAFALLRAVGDGTVPLNYRRYSAADALDTLPFTRIIRDRGRLKWVAAYTEYQVDWPERLAVDLALEAERCGAVVMNHTPVLGFAQEGRGWRLRAAPRGSATALEVSARLLLNFAGPWIDRVNAAAGSYRRVVKAVKGAHIVVRLPEEFHGHGLMTLTSDEHPFYCFPSRDAHFMGPTETPCEGDLDDVRADEDDIENLLGEAGAQLPGHPIGRGDIRYTWAGLRPLTHDPQTQAGVRNRVLHDLTQAGGPPLLALTNGSIGAHRVTGADTLAAIKRLLPPALGGAPDPRPGASAPEIAGNGAACVGETFRRMAREEHVLHLTDLMWGRAGLVWNDGHGQDVIEDAARILAEELAWDEARVTEEIAAYRRLIGSLFGVSRERVTAPG
jgi:glycerol-3-phosphate dehydrogenase